MAVALAETFPPPKSSTRQYEHEILFRGSDHHPRKYPNKRIGALLFVNSWFYSWMGHTKAISSATNLVKNRLLAEALFSHGYFDTLSTSFTDFH